MRLFPILLCGAFGGALLIQPAQAGDPGYGAPGYHHGRYARTTYSPWAGGRLMKPWKYPSTYPWSQPVTYNAGPGNYYPAHHARMRQKHANPRWTGFPPRHLYVVDYNGYAPQYGFYPQY